MIAQIKNLFARFMVYEKRPARFAAACSMALYVAFSPFLGFHTLMIIAASWLFGLNFPVMLGVSLLVSNPWSMVLIYGIGYLFGDWVLTSIGINHYAFNPSWIGMINGKLIAATGYGNVSLPAFLLGGNLLGLMLAFISYPIIKYLAGALQLNGSSMVSPAISKSSSQITKRPHRAPLSRTQYETGSPK